MSGLPVPEAWNDAVLAVFKRRQTGFLTTDSLLKEIHLQKEVRPKEDKEHLEAVLRQMQEEGLIAFNQFKLASLTDAGKAAVEAMTPERLAEIEKADRERTQ